MLAFISHLRRFLAESKVITKSIISSEHCPICGCDYPYEWGETTYKLPPIDGFIRKGERYGRDNAGCPKCHALWDRKTGRQI